MFMNDAQQHHKILEMAIYELHWLWGCDANFGLDFGVGTAGKVETRTAGRELAFAEHFIQEVHFLRLISGEMLASETVLEDISTSATDLEELFVPELCASQVGRCRSNAATSGWPTSTDNVSQCTSSWSWLWSSTVKIKGPCGSWNDRIEEIMIKRTTDENITSKMSPFCKETQSKDHQMHDTDAEPLHWIYHLSQSTIKVMSKVLMETF